MVLASAAECNERNMVRGSLHWPIIRANPTRGSPGSTGPKRYFGRGSRLPLMESTETACSRHLMGTDTWLPLSSSAFVLWCSVFGCRKQVGANWGGMIVKHVVIVRYRLLPSPNIQWYQQPTPFPSIPARTSKMGSLATALSRHMSGASSRCLGWDGGRGGGGSSLLLDSNSQMFWAGLIIAQCKASLTNWTTRKLFLILILVWTSVLSLQIWNTNFGLH